MGTLQKMKKLLALLLALEMVLGTNGFTVLAESLPEEPEVELAAEAVTLLVGEHEQSVDAVAADGDCPDRSAVRYSDADPARLNVRGDVLAAVVREEEFDCARGVIMRIYRLYRRLRDIIDRSEVGRFCGNDLHSKHLSLKNRRGG